MAALSEQTIYQALINAGLSRNQAAGVEGNMISESSLDPEQHPVDSNGYRSYGLIQWNAGSYPGASSLVTGNVSRDLAAQINYLLHDTNNISKGLAGTTATQVAGNFAQYVEVCAGCAPGGASYNKRVAQAQAVYNAAVSGNWPAGGSGVDTSASNVSTSGSNADLNLGPLDIPLPNLGGILHLPTPSSIAQGLLGGLASAFGLNDIRDLMERLGLILLGGLVIGVGLFLLKSNSSDGKSGTTNNNFFGAPPSKSSGNTTVSSTVVDRAPAASAAEDSAIIDAEVIEPAAITAA